MSGLKGVPEEKAETSKISYQYMTGKDGHYLKKRTRLFDAVVKVDVNPDLPVIEESATFTAQKIPYAVLAEAIAFFRAVWAKTGAEAIVLLWFDKGQWSVHAPAQIVGPASLKYGRLQNGLTPVGSIHSHGAMGAFHSGTDRNDAAEFDGVHIVVGRLDRAVPELAVALHVNGKGFDLEPEQVIEGLPVAAVKEDDHPWLEMVEPSRILKDLATFNCSGFQKTP